MSPYPTDEATDQHQLNLSEIIVERAAFYQERVANVEAGAPQDQQLIANRLSNEYQNLRIALVSTSKPNESLDPN